MCLIALVVVGTRKGRPLSFELQIIKENKRKKMIILNRKVIRISFVNHKLQLGVLSVINQL